MAATNTLNTLPLTSKKSTIGLPLSNALAAPSLNLTKLKRMPHLFTRVLELPLHAETPVKVFELRDFFLFEVQLSGLAVGDVKVEVLEIVPGATKVLVRGVEPTSPVVGISEVDFWRFRLPSTTLPEKSAASYDRGTLSVTIPKVLVPCSEDRNRVNSNENSDTSLSHDADESVKVVQETQPFHDHLDTEMDKFETDEERMQREVLEDLESFGSPRRARYSPCTSRSSIPQPAKSYTDPEKIQEVLDDLECFGSPRRSRSVSCTQSFAQQSRGAHQDFFRSVGSWVGGFSVYVQ
jgi:HSP20 family molecular chaperone IbpA